jgi:hypothetical protein
VRRGKEPVGDFAVGQALGDDARDPDLGGRSSLPIRRSAPPR